MLDDARAAYSSTPCNQRPCDGVCAAQQPMRRSDRADGCTNLQDDIDAAFREWQNAVATEASLPFNGSGYVASDRQRIFQDNFNYIQRRKQEDPDLGVWAHPTLQQSHPAP